MNEIIVPVIIDYSKMKDCCYVCTHGGSNECTINCETNRCNKCCSKFKADEEGNCRYVFEIENPHHSICKNYQESEYAKDDRKRAKMFMIDLIQTIKDY